MATGVTIPTKDKYDIAVEHLRQHPGEIEEAWTGPKDHIAGCLFQFAQKNPNEKVAASGCLTMIRSETFFGVESRPDLTKEIRNDARIPDSDGGITSDNLPVFAEWQRRLDRELRNDESGGR